MRTVPVMTVAAVCRGYVPIMASVLGMMRRGIFRKYLEGNFHIAFRHSLAFRQLCFSSYSPDDDISHKQNDNEDG